VAWQAPRPTRIIAAIAATIFVMDNR